MAKGLSRVCNMCSKSFPLTNKYFHRHKNDRHGLAVTCKPCSTERSRKWRVNKRNQIRARVRYWKSKGLTEAQAVKRANSDRDYRTNKSRGTKPKAPKPVAAAPNGGLPDLAGKLLEIAEAVEIGNALKGEAREIFKAGLRHRAALLQDEITAALASV